MERFERIRFFGELLGACESAEYREKLEMASRACSPDDLVGLGNRIEALHSVPTAIASFAITPQSFESTISNVILLGGDTDTMAGALSGAYLGVGRLPGRLLGLLENGEKGREYLLGLSEQLFDLYDRGLGPVRDR